MAHFYGNMQGNRGGVTRGGSKDSGMCAHVRGWNIGVRVSVSQLDGKDVVHVYRTGGSNGATSEELIAQYDADTPKIRAQVCA